MLHFIQDPVLGRYKSNQLCPLDVCVVFFFRLGFIENCYNSDHFLDNFDFFKSAVLVLYVEVFSYERRVPHIVSSPLYIYIKSEIQKWENYIFLLQQELNHRHHL